VVFGLVDYRMGAVHHRARRLVHLIGAQLVVAAFLGAFRVVHRNPGIGHDKVEDQHYFPQLAGMESRLSRGFDILDHDLHDLNALIDGFTAGADAALGQEEDAAFRETIPVSGRNLPGFRQC
jgi:hypothetical protein